MVRRYAAITVASAAVVVGGGVAFGGTAQHSGPQPPTPTPTPSRPAPSLSQIQSSLGKQCEQAVEQFRQQHPEGYDAGCNSGSSTLTVP